MGEFAGYALDEAVDAENERWVYRLGQMSDERAFDLGIIDHEGYYNHVPAYFPVGMGRWTPSLSKQRTCRACGQAGLHWGHAKGSVWRLFDGNSEHVCGGKGARSLIRNLCP